MKNPASKNMEPTTVWAMKNCFAHTMTPELEKHTEHIFFQSITPELKEWVSQVIADGNITNIILHFYNDCQLNQNGLDLIRQINNSGKLTGFHFRGPGGSTEAFNNICNELKSSTTLTTLVATYTTTLEQAQAIADLIRNKKSSLNDVNLLYGTIASGGIEAITDALNDNSTITRLNLCGCKIEESGARVVAKLIQSNKTITTLDLSSNNIKHDGEKAIAEALENNKTLTRLDLSGNHIWHAKSIADALIVNDTLIELKLNDNMIGGADVAPFAAALEKNKSLNTLSLGYVLNASDDNRETLKQIDDLLEWNKNTPKIKPVEKDADKNIKTQEQIEGEKAREAEEAKKVEKKRAEKEQADKEQVERERAENERQALEEKKAREQAEEERKRTQANEKKSQEKHKSKTKKDKNTIEREDITNNKTETDSTNVKQTSVTQSSNKQQKDPAMLPPWLIGAVVGSVAVPLAGAAVAAASYQLLKQLHYEQQILGAIDQLNKINPHSAQFTTALAVVTLIAVGATIGLKISCKIEIQIKQEESGRSA